jgi:hypothetical protein
MKPTELTVEDWEEYLMLLELDEIDAREEAMRLCAEQEEAEFRSREGRPHECMGLPAQEPEFDGSEEDDNLPDYVAGRWVA